MIIFGWWHGCRQAILNVKNPQDVCKQLELPDQQELFLTISLESFEQLPTLGMEEGVQLLDVLQSKTFSGAKGWTFTRIIQHWG